MKKFKLNVKREVKLLSALGLIGLLIAFSERKQNEVAVRDVAIKLENVADNHFLRDADVMKLMDIKIENLKGASLDKIDLRELEAKIKRNRFVGDADIYSDLKGNLVVRVSLHRPVARIIRNDGPDGYIAEDGTIMPVSEGFTSRVVLIGGPYVNQMLNMQNLNDSEDGKKLMEMLDLVNKSDFWRAQISQLDIDNQVNISILQQVGGELIEFGKPERLEVKLKKLMIYYKEILPRMGWNTYKRVNIEYDGQIIAE